MLKRRQESAWRVLKNTHCLLRPGQAGQQGRKHERQYDQ
jgi:hypothetical protein